MKFSSIYNVPLADDDEEEKKNQKAPDPFSDRFLKTRQIILTGEINKELADSIVRQLLILDSEDSASSINFVKWARELLKEVGMPVGDFIIPTRAEKVFVKEGNIYYQSPFIEGFKAVKAKMLQARLQKYANKAEFPVGMSIIADRGMFTAPFDISGEIKIANI